MVPCFPGRKPQVSKDLINKARRTECPNPALLPQDDCSEFRSQFEAGGRLSCTRENAPVRDASGKQHTNKCLMCAEKL